MNFLNFFAIGDPTIVYEQDLQNMMNNGAQFVIQNYAVFSSHFPTLYMSELGMTDIIMAYGNQWAVQYGKTTTWARSDKESTKGSDFEVKVKIGVNQYQQDRFMTVYFQAKTIKTNTAYNTNNQLVDFIYESKSSSKSSEFQNLLLQNFVKKENDAGRPSIGYYICYGPNAVTYVDVRRISKFIDMRNQIKPFVTTNIGWNIELYKFLAQNTMQEATAVLFDAQD